jgi:hypothetical protein
MKSSKFLGMSFGALILSIGGAVFARDVPIICIYNGIAAIVFAIFSVTYAIREQARGGE